MASQETGIVCDQFFQIASLFSALSQLLFVGPGMIEHGEGTVDI